MRKDLIKQMNKIYILNENKFQDHLADFFLSLLKNDQSFASLIDPKHFHV